MTKKSRKINKDLPLADVDFSGGDYTGADFSGKDLSHAWFDHAILKDADLSRCILHEVNFRHADLRGANLKGANLYGAIMEDALLTDVITDKNTRHFRLHCPAEGAFIAYKRCYNHRLVTLLVPADAKRSSATRNSCRTDKAYVVAITDFDFKEHFNEAISLIDENFIYCVGEMVFAENFNPDRWRDSTGGIHFWMTKEEAFAY